MDETEPILTVISAFEVPRFSYNVDRKKFLSATEKQAEIIGPAVYKAKLFRDR